MRRLSGQAARWVWAVLRLLLALALGFAVVATGGFAVLAWQLAEHPIEMPWLAARIKAEASAAAAPADLHVGAATLAWEGFRAGLGAPIDIRLTNVSVSDPADGLRIEAPRVQLVLELAPLLRGRLRPRSLAVLDARVTLALARPRPAAANAEGTGWQAALRQLGGRVVVRGAQISAPGRGWDVTRLDAELRRQRDGGADASAAVTATLGGAAVTASLQAVQAPSGTTRLHAALGPMRPAVLAVLWPAIGGSASMLDAPVAGEAELTVDHSLALKNLRFDLHAEPGSLRAGDAPVSVLGGRLAGSWQAGEVARAEASSTCARGPSSRSRAWARAAKRRSVLMGRREKWRLTSIAWISAISPPSGRSVSGAERGTGCWRTSRRGWRMTGTPSSGSRHPNICPGCRNPM